MPQVTAPLTPLSRAPLVGWTDGTTGSLQAQEEFDVYGWEGQRIKYWNPLSLAGCTTLVLRMPMTRFGEPLSIEHILRLEDTDFSEQCAIFHKQHPLTRINVYARPFTDLSNTTLTQRASSARMLTRLLNIARGGVPSPLYPATDSRIPFWVENANGGWQGDCVQLFKAESLYAGQEPLQEIQALHTYDHPCIVMEKMLRNTSPRPILLDGSNWPATHRPFSDPARPPYTVVLTDKEPLTHARIRQVRKWGWVVGAYFHQLLKLFSSPSP